MRTTIASPSMKPSTAFLSNPACPRPMSLRTTISALRSSIEATCSSDGIPEDGNAAVIPSSQSQTS